MVGTIGAGGITPLWLLVAIPGGEVAEKETMMKLTYTRATIRKIKIKVDYEKAILVYMQETGKFPPRFLG